MIVGEPPAALRRPGQAFGLPNHYTMIVGEPPAALRRPGQAFGLPNHYTIFSKSRKGQSLLDESRWIDGFAADIPFQMQVLAEGFLRRAVSHRAEDFACFKLLILLHEAQCIQ